MSGYEWHPKVRMTPDNGAAETYDLRTLLTDASGPVRTDLRYRDEGETKKDVNLAAQRIHRGLRPEVRLRCDIATMADHTTLATVVSRLMRSDWKVELSLDGGVIYREVVLDRVPIPRGFRGKTVGGASFDLGLRCVDTLDDLAPMMTDPIQGMAQILLNPGLETWSGGNPVGWSPQESAGTVDEDNTNQRTGAACAKMDRTGVGTLTLSQNRFFTPDKWAEVGFYLKASATTSAAALLRIYNATANEYVTSSGKVWGASASVALSCDLTTTWTLFTFRFWIDSGFAATDTIRPIIYHNAENAVDVYVDDAYCNTPVLPEGVSSW